MRRIFLIFLIAVFCAIMTAQNDFSEFSRQQNEQFRTFRDTQARELANYYSVQDSLFIQFKEQIEREWNEYRESTMKEWVSYSRDFRGRSLVDFEAGKIAVEAVMPSEEEDAKEKAVELVKEQLKAIVTEKDETEKTVLESQVSNPLNPSEILTPDNIDRIAEQIVESAKPTEVLGGDNVMRVRYSISLELVPDHIKRRAEQYRPYIEQKCRRFQVRPSLVLAIIHTESFFNPKAYNRHGNAYGLMQIVPRYAGIQMNRILYNKQSEPTANELFNPERNLEMGIAYINWLSNNVWQDVQNETNRNYVVICSYNGGHGSVHQAILGKRRFNSQERTEMMNTLSTMDSEVLYRKLRTDIPWEETRNYIKTVRERMYEIYASIDR